MNGARTAKSLLLRAARARWLHERAGAAEAGARVLELRAALMRRLRRRAVPDRGLRAGAESRVPPRAGGRSGLCP
jgi:hypothetical protein